jgi:hypothetical protein
MSIVGPHGAGPDGFPVGPRTGQDHKHHLRSMSPRTGIRHGSPA